MLNPKINMCKTKRKKSVRLNWPNNKFVHQTTANDFLFGLFLHFLKVYFVDNSTRSHKQNGSGGIPQLCVKGWEMYFFKWEVGVTSITSNIKTTAAEKDNRNTYPQPPWKKKPGTLTNVLKGGEMPFEEVNRMFKKNKKRESNFAPDFSNFFFWGRVLPPSPAKPCVLSTHKI